MQFCKDCGGVLNLFGQNERELCSSCVQNRKKLELPETPPPPSTGSIGDEALHELLKDAVLSIESGKVVLRSKEGWELWSGLSGSSIQIQNMLSRAGRIYQIRLRRQKN